MSKKAAVGYSEDMEVVEFTQSVPVVYVFSRALREGVDTVIVEGSVDLSSFSEKVKKVSVCNITLPLADAIKFADDMKNYCVTSAPPEPENGLSEENQDA